MARKRIGLQCKISSIFSQVPVPKKDKQSPTSSTSKPTTLNQPKTTVSYKQPTESRQRTTSVQVINTKIPKKPKHELAKIAWLRRNKNFGTLTGLNPKRQKRGLILLLILSFLLVVVLVRNFDIYRNEPITSEVEDKTVSPTLAETNIEIKWPMPKKYPLEIRDPMELPEEIERPDLIVRGIVTIEDRLFAIIGKKLVGEGETVNGAKITKIDPDKVQFELDGTKWTKAKTSDLVVKGIVIGEDRPKTLIGIQVIEQGKTIYGVTVVKINQNNVEFELNGKRWIQEVEDDKK